MLKPKTLHIIVIGLVLVLMLFKVSFLWYVGVVFLWFSIMVYGSFVMNAGFFLSSFSGNAHILSRKIAITFDDGPNKTYTPQVLNLLKAYNAKATFFCIGKQVEKHPEILKLMVDSGHQIGNHSYSHNYFIDFSSESDWMVELDKTDKAIEAIIQFKPTCFRPPYGVTTPKLAKAINKTGHIVVGWNLRSFDTVIKNPKTIVKRIKNRLHPGAVILLHDKQANCIPVLECLLQHCIQQNYKLVSINELLHEV